MGHSGHIPMEFDPYEQVDVLVVLKLGNWMFKSHLDSVLPPLLRLPLFGHSLGNQDNQ
jgi:hypothetical protein